MLRSQHPFFVAMAVCTKGRGGIVGDTQEAVGHIALHAFPRTLYLFISPPLVRIMAGITDHLAVFYFIALGIEGRKIGHTPDGSNIDTDRMGMIGITDPF